MLFPLYYLYRLIDGLLRIIYLLLIVYCVMSWFASRANKFFQLLSLIFDPILKPFRYLQAKLLGSRLAVDLSPILAVFAIELCHRLLAWMFRLLRW